MKFWLVSLTTRDSAGDIAAIAAVFSGRGIPIESFIGFGRGEGDCSQAPGQIVVTFEAFEDRCRSLCRLLESLEAVTKVCCYAKEQIPAEWLEKSKQIKTGLPSC